MTVKQRKYVDGFKEQALTKVFARSGDQTVRSIAADVGMNMGTLRGWMKGKGSSIHILPRLIWAGDAVCCGKWPWTESTMKTQSELTGREQQYLGHLRGAQARQLTLAQYCRAQGLSAQSLYRVSHRLARKGILWHREEVAKKPQPAGKFLAVRVAAPAAVGTVCRLQHPNGWVMECASWPEASLLAQFVTGGSHATP